ncbi:MAG: PEP-CTERM sorting domain-containing protein [Trichodesmium sp.]
MVDSFAKNSSGRDLLRLYGDQRWTNLDADDVVLGGTRGSWMFRDGVQRVVVLEVAEGGGGVVEVSASTPEPSLIFGFITLGGLMLGSKRKIKG